MPKRAGKGSHGSLGKAGSTRVRNPMRWDLFDRKSKSGYKLRNKRKSKIPRISNRRKYNREFILDTKRDNKQERKGRYSR
uniref:Uncharacterized protein n=1 Tax=viral metagenome TaxID=1070528 RepID=A0A6H2A0V7_9ZZZZ